MADSKLASEFTQQIKVALQLRAKYNHISEKYFHPYAVVPHPQNRGGDPMKKLRLMSITSHICANGVDPVEANQNAVLVMQAPPTHTFTNGPMAGRGSFLEQFAKSIEGESEIASHTGTDVTGGSPVSYTHLRAHET